MRIALAGSGGTGKTTLSNAVGERFGIPVISEFARETAAEMGVAEIRQMTPEQSYEFQSRIFQKKIEEELKHKSFVADRSTADNIAYYLRWCARDNDDSKNAVYIEKCIKHLKVYDLVMILPWQGIPLEDDGFRSVRLYYQYGIHCLIVGILKDNGIEYQTMPFTNMEDRINYLGELFK